MTTILKPIALNEKSYNVALLHQALAALGLPVSPEEVSHYKAGTDTLRKVRALQEQLHVAIDDSILLDETTAHAIAAFMTERGLTSASRSFSVSGEVKLSNGSIKTNQRLIAFDLDLRGVSIYRTLKDLKEAKKQGGFEYLGEAISDNKGRYSISFYDWQYSRAERKLADIVVYALTDKDEIIGHSRLVNTEDYSDKGFVRGFDIILFSQDERTEYQALMDPVGKFLKQSKSSLTEIGLSSDQLNFTASELDVSRANLGLAATAALLAKEEERLSHELLYGIARQDIGLSWSALYKKQDEELRTAIKLSVGEGIIQEFDDNKTAKFIAAIQRSSISHILDDKDDDDNNALTDMLSNALPKKAQREAYLKALGDFKGNDFRDFWETHLPEQSEFKDKPELITAIQLTQQLTELAGNHQALVKELQREQGIKSVRALVDLTADDWLEVVKKSGVPDFIDGKDEDEKQQNYVDSLQNQLNATLPTQRIAKMVKDNQLGIEKTSVAEGVSRFLKKNENFSFAGSRVHDFENEIEEESIDGDAKEVKAELMKIHRVFQVSTSPGVMTVLLENDLHSAYSIASIPRGNFIKTYGKALGGERTANSVHQRAEFISRRIESITMDVKQYALDTATPDKAMSQAGFSQTDAIFKDKLPNYKNLFGSPDLCECQHCRSVYSPAAYFVELLRFLELSTFEVEIALGDKESRSPYDYLVGKKNEDLSVAIPGRRPDLAELALSCENTNTLIPYIDLANEVMEFYVADGSLDKYIGEDTGEATADELRANPQHTDIEAYRILSDNEPDKPAKYPFTLPFHQPLDEIRTYSDFLNVSRYEVMQAINPQTNDVEIEKAIGAESLHLSPEGYDILVDGTSDIIKLREYFGYDNAPLAPGDLEVLSPVREFMERAGVAYTDLVELIKTKFINPHQDTLNYLEKIFSQATIDAEVLYAWLKQVNTDQSTTNDTAIKNALETEENNVSLDELKQWSKDHFDEFQQVITLFEPSSICNLDTTRLRVIQQIYEDPDKFVLMANLEEKLVLGSAGITNDSWSKLHRFIRLWRKTGWSIHETDLMLNALSEDNIRPETIAKLESVLLLKNESKLPLNQLAVLWGNIDTYGKHSLYKKLFLNKAVQKLDPAFVANTQGNYLQNLSVKLVEHQSAILAAFRISEEDLTAIINVAHVIDEQGDPHQIDIAVDPLSLENLSAIYRPVILAKAVKLSVTDLCKLIGLFESTPFNSPEQTYEFYQLAASTKAAKFKPAVLEYIFTGALPVDSRLGLDTDKVLQTAKVIRNGLALIDQNHPIIPNATLTSEIVAAKLSMSFRQQIVSRFMDIVEGTAIFTMQIDDNLGVTIPNDLKIKYSYVEGSGRLSCIGIMSDGEREALKNNNISDEFKTAVDELYKAPESFIRDAFKEVFSIHNPEHPDNLIHLDNLRKTLLNRPTADPAVSLDAKLEYIYQSFLPLVKKKLKHDAISSHIADLIGLSEAATTLLIADDIETLSGDLSTPGFTASYYNNLAGEEVDWNDDSKMPSLNRVDNTVNFSWQDGSPNPNAVIADNFSARWESYIAAPATGEYTLIVEVDESDEAFNLYLDGELVLNKESGDEKTSFEKVVKLNAAQLHLFILEYVEASGSAGIKLRWRTATSAPEVIPAAVTYPALILNRFVQTASVLHRAAKCISGFDISETELQHFISFNGDFDEIDFNKLKPKHWMRIRDYTNLRNSVPQAQALLTDMFAFTQKSSSLSEDEQPIVKIYLELIDKIYNATGWAKVNLGSSIRHFVPGAFDTSLPPKVVDLPLIVNSFKDEIVLNRIHSVMKIVAKSGLAAQAITEWGKAERDFGKLHDTAQILKNAVKAKYDEKEWLEIAGGLSDKIRASQQQALISYLLVQPSIRDANVKDADGLYEHLLIDVQMGACMNTSRMVQANAAIQLFVNRILMNLEKDISPDTIDINRWQWMKNYRVWEANRKVFLYPENWLEPEWRNDRSEFFKELESHLLQNDITSRSVEQGLRNYLMSLNEVANLDVCGMHQENDADDKLKCLHVFGRTHNLPYKYFYRRWNEYQKWSAWEKVQVDIRSVEEGENSGVHLVPVVWKGRLFLFWPEFMEAAKESIEGKTTSYGDRESRLPGNFGPDKYWEIRLAWSEYVEGAWSPKQVSKEYLTTTHSLSAVRIHPSFDNQENSLIFLVAYDRIYGKYFFISDIHSPIKANNDSCSGGMPTLIYGNKYVKLVTKNKPLQSPFSNIYLRAKKDHELLKVNGLLDMEFDSSTPFFYSEGHRTYFASPEQSGVSVNSLDNKIASNLRLADGGVRQLRDKGFPAFMNEDGWHSNTPVITDPIIIISDPIFGGADGIAGGRPVLGDFVTVEPCRFIIKYGKPLRKRTSGSDQGLNFHTFYHPYSSEYVRRLNQSGIPFLMEINTDKSFDEADGEIIFENVYDPNFDNGLVNRYNPLSVADNSRTAYKENICFDVLGANSQYNWELFFHAPLYIATRLSKNGKYEEAMKWFHYIFDPTTSEKPKSENDTARYWKVRPFKAESETVETLETWFRRLSPNSDPDNPGNTVINEWRDNPFDPHLVASNRPISYMKHVVIKYIENLIAWGDSQFRQFTRESVYEAIQLYVIASHVLGKRPEFVPKRGEIKTETYATLKDKLDDFGNALVELENIFPYTSAVNIATTSTGGNLLGIGSALYFCIPANDKLLGYWDTVADRLFKIRHCQDLDGVERGLALFAPAIDPAALIQARSQGLSLGSILADLSSPPPIYRFAYLVQKANEFCNDVKALGSAVLSALEKKDGEELSRLRSSQETTMLERVTGIRERQVLSAKVSIENLLKVRETAKFRLQHYKDLLGDDSDEPDDSPSLDAILTANGPLPGDTSIPLIETKVDLSLVDSDENGVKLIPREKEELEQSAKASYWQQKANWAEMAASSAYFIPDFIGTTAPLGNGFQIEFGGKNIGPAISATAKAFNAIASGNLNDAQRAGKFTTYIRRTHDWSLQANLAIREIIQLDKQITSADIQLQVAEKELQNHHQQIENAQQVELFLKDKFTNQELYQWMKEQLFSVYKQSYNLAFEMAKKAEKAYQYELGTETTSFVQYGYWDNSKQGLVAGEKLQLGLRQLEKSYLEENRRELELSKSISLALLNPLALIELRETGKCYVSLPEELFDLDFQGHYFRRIKAASLSIPCIAGPYTTVNCSLRLLKNTMRTNTSLNSEGEYEHENDEGLWTDDDRFRSSHVPVTSIATSTGQNDAGMFEFNFRDERYLPFEGAGVISNWQIELSTEKELRQFDYSTISDVILHLKYTAREDGGPFKKKAVEYIRDEFIRYGSDRANQPLMRMFSMKHEFPTEWHRFLHPANPADGNVFELEMSPSLFPLRDLEKTLKVNTIWLLARCTDAGSYDIVMTPPLPAPPPAGSDTVTLAPVNQYGGLHFSQKDVAAVGIEVVPTAHPVKWQLKMTRPGGGNLQEDPVKKVMEVEDVLLVLGYEWE